MERGRPSLSAAEVAARAAGARSLAEVEAGTVACRACPRLVAWREQVPERAAYAGQDYWRRPVPGWGADRPWLLVVGLAPGAHGANRTGRVFTGDRSGEWLYGALHRAGLAALPTSTAVGDGQQLTGVRISLAVRCAPPGNRPSPVERDACAPWLRAELDLLWPDLQVVLALGAFAWDVVVSAWRARGLDVPVPRPRFAHGAELAVPGAPVLLGSYHVSQQNTATGRLSRAMLDAAIERAVDFGSLRRYIDRDRPDLEDTPKKSSAKGWTPRNRLRYVQRTGPDGLIVVRPNGGAPMSGASWL